MSEYRALVRDEFQLGLVRLLLARRRHDGQELLMSDGTWRFEAHDEVVEDGGVGLLIERHAIPVLLDALREFVGERGPSEGEVRVLREWLAHERSRVDSLMPPREDSP